ncbi:MAG: hypothetical protein IT436_16815 [Phycisphaerales bacterium]|nr:hypothetical protein [Phycisphaerales bacterium]
MLTMIGLTASLWILVIVAIDTSNSVDGQVAFGIFGPCAVTPISAGLILAEIIITARLRARKAVHDGDVGLASWIWSSLLFIACVLTLWAIVTGTGF